MCSLLFVGVGAPVVYVSERVFPIVASSGSEVADTTRHLPFVGGLFVSEEVPVVAILTDPQCWLPTS